jgi:hypothetical protein
MADETEIARHLREKQKISNAPDEIGGNGQQMAEAAVSQILLGIGSEEELFQGCLITNKRQIQRMDLHTLAGGLKRVCWLYVAIQAAQPLYDEICGIQFYWLSTTGSFPVG